MKKFDRLPPEERKEEIQNAAAAVFREKGFAAATMENIVEKVSLSKGGVYRLYPSTAAILGDLMLRGMHLRNAYYEERVAQEIGRGQTLTLEFLVEMIGDSLLLYPEISQVYVEFLWEKQRNPELEDLYQTICRETVAETTDLLQKYHADCLFTGDTLSRLTELMNGAILSLRVLHLEALFSQRKQAICKAILEILKGTDDHA